MKPGRRRQRGDEMRSVGRASGHIGKFYAVRKGRQTGIFHSWRDCQAQVNQFPGGIYKSFKSQGEAEAWLQAPISGQAPRRHTLGPVQVTGSSLGGSPLYRESSPRRHSMSPQAFSTFGAMGLPTTPGTPQAYPSPADSRAHSGSAPAQPQFRATPLGYSESDPLRMLLPAAVGSSGACSEERPSAEVKYSGEHTARAENSQRGGDWHFLEFDGASKGNPGRGGAGAVLKDPNGDPMLYITEGMARSTSNQAEYCALIAGLQEACALGIPRLRVQGDSLLVISQCQGLWAVRHPGLLPLAEEAQALLGKFQDVELKHVPRERNTLADRLSNDAICLGDGVRHKATTYHSSF